MSADQPQTETAARRARRRGGGTTSCADTDALASVRDHLLAARADAALALVWPVWAPSAADGPMWLVEAIEAVLRDLDRQTGTSSDDWDTGDM